MNAAVLPVSTAEINREAHSASALRYKLLPGPLRLAPLQILRECSQAWGVWQITFYVLGASHAMRFEHDGFTVTELLTCGQTSTELGSVIDSRVDPGRILTGAAGGLHFQVELRSGRDLLSWSLNNEIAAMDRLDQPFPNPDSAEPSWTRIGWIIRDDALVLETLHSYPQETICVHSTTTVTHAGPRAQETNT